MDRADAQQMVSGDSPAIVQHDATKQHFFSFPHLGHMALIGIDRIVTDKVLADEYSKLEDPVK